MSKVIGVFDSGVGGKSIVQAIQKALPDHKVIYADDTAHLPYGDKTPEQLLGFVVPILEDLQTQCDVIVIACNTVTTTLIEQLRQKLQVPLIGMEPMVKPAAAATKSGIIAVCATPTTLASQRYRWLKDTYAKDITVLEPDCSRWAYMIEHNQVDDDTITEQINAVCDQGADVIVLGCTHYHWIEERIKVIALDRAQVLQPEAAVISQLQRVIAQLP